MLTIMPYAGELPPLEVGVALFVGAVGGVTGTEWVGGSDRAYYDLLAELWVDGETFRVVEHDIVVNHDTLRELTDCPHDWCAAPFEYMGKPTYGLGCVKFSSALIARNPDAMKRVGAMHDERHPKRHWCRLDAWLTVVLEGAGEKRHEHTTMVRHLNTGCSHGCTNVA